MAASVQAVILGGGPAGAAAAIGMAKRSVAVVVLERSQYDATRLGETLPPAAVPLLHRLGVWEAFQKDAHRASPGIVSIWGSEQPYENDFIFNPYGQGWHLDRSRFDRTLAAEAERAGATVLRSTRVQSCTRTAAQEWCLRYECAGAVREISATFLIDASGRSAWLARQQGTQRIVLDRLVGVIGYGECSEDEDPRTILEATRDGWWYSARLPNGKVVAAYMTDSDLLPRGPENVKQFWLAQRRNAPRTAGRWSNPNESGELRIAFSGSVRLDRVCGPGWLAVGDAASAFDPLSSQGIMKALESGWRGAEQVVEILQGNVNAPSDYLEWLAAEIAAYTRNYFHYYGQEKRWPESSFWRRRQLPAPREETTERSSE